MDGIGNSSQFRPFFKTETGQEILVSKNNETKVYRLFLDAAGPNARLTDLASLGIGKKITYTGDSVSFESSKIEDVFNFIHAAKKCDIISEKECLQLKNFISASEVSEEEPDVDEEMSSAIEKLFSENLCDMPENSAFLDTDLVIFKDSYLGILPKNGIKESEFKKISTQFDEICKNKSYVKLIVKDPEKLKTVQKAIKNLLTRDIGRRLMDKFASNEKYAVLIDVADESEYLPNHKKVLLSLSNEHFKIGVAADGSYKLFNCLLPHVTLAHEMIHHLHFVDLKAQISCFKKPTFEKVYDNLEEQVTITGFYKEPEISDFISDDKRLHIYEHFEEEVDNKNSLEIDAIVDQQQEIYDEFNERAVMNAFADSSNVYLPRFGHKGFEGAERFKELSIIGLLLTHDMIPELLKTILEVEEVKIEIDTIDYSSDKWKYVQHVLEKLLSASEDSNNSWHPHLQNPEAKAKLESILAKRKMYINIRENALQEADKIIQLGIAPNKDFVDLWGGDKNFMLGLVKQGFSLKYVSKELKEDEEVVLAAIKCDMDQLEFANQELKGNKKFVLNVIADNIRRISIEGILKNVDKRLKGDEEVVLSAIKPHPRDFKFASQELKGNKKFVLAAIELCTTFEIFLLASKELQRDEDVVSAAVKKFGSAILDLVSDD